jgi:hypothetical protein
MEKETSLMCERQGRHDEYLGKLSAELSAKGLKCELVTTGCEPRLWLNVAECLPYYRPDDDFQDHVLVSLEPDGIRRFWWPWVEPITPVEEMARAVDHIMEVYRDDDEDQDQQPEDPPPGPAAGGTTPA